VAVNSNLCPLLISLGALFSVAPVVRQSAPSNLYSSHATLVDPRSDSPLPPLKILMPSNGALVGSYMAIIFQTRADLTKMTMSAPVAGVHLHIECDGVTLMPMYDQLIRLGNQRYIFLFDLPAKPGPKVVRVYWSDAQHRPLETSLQKIHVTVVGD
jgi:hypothetical protein